MFSRLLQNQARIVDKVFTKPRARGKENKHDDQHYQIPEGFPLLTKQHMVSPG
jgi:hypothetical protein